MLLPAIPVNKAEKRLIPVAQAVKAARPGATRIFLPATETGKRIAVGGHGGPMLQLAASSFLDPADDALPRMLGLTEEKDRDHT